MLNVIRMELHRMLHTRSFYITLAVNILLIALLFSVMAPSLNEGFAAEQAAADTSISQSVEGWKMEMVLDNRNAPNPINVCCAFTDWCILFVVIFMACFVGRFYKDGFCKNVMGSRGYRFRFQMAQSVCAVIYSAVNVILTAAVSLLLAKALIHSFTFAYLDMFGLYLLGQFLLLCAIGSFSAFLTEWTHSTVPAIVYIFLLSTNIVAMMTAYIDSHLSDWLHKEIVMADCLPSLYYTNQFLLDVSDSTKNNAMLLHAVMLSMIFSIVYNVAGSVLLTKRDVK